LEYFLYVDDFIVEPDPDVFPPCCLDIFAC